MYSVCIVSLLKWKKTMYLYHTLYFVSSLDTFINPECPSLRVEFQRSKEIRLDNRKMCEPTADPSMDVFSEEVIHQIPNLTLTTTLIIFTWYLFNMQDVTEMGFGNKDIRQTDLTLT